MKIWKLDDLLILFTWYVVSRGNGVLHRLIQQTFFLFY